MSSVEWTKEAMDLLTMPEYVHYFALLKLTGDAATNVKPKGRTVAALIKNFQEHLIDKLRNLTAFKSSTRDTIKEDALDVLEQVGDMPIGPECHI
ncbi:hypothetical protein GGH94_001983 [Coemansia aciculifera]|uniref:Uncharacterized protein n=1 Tax=Coemansia aciculifera TaxID=417176 RepID=A0A9W8M751_9FUNG|nr:hypothetical protein GGH94_001983 [Coemansia aciculifera]KAJ2875432.1 hypothetical protein GGH93_001585 [Coemansia aciculifera]